MKLYTEQQVIKMLIETDKFTPLHIDYLLKDINPIELPSDELIGQEFKFLSENWEICQAAEYGAKWMRYKIQGDNK